MSLFKSRFIVFFCAGFIGLNSTIYAATIKGNVTDAGTKEMLVGVVVVVKELSKGFASDLEGNYVIKHLSAGSYTLAVRYSGYKEQEKQVVIANDNDVVMADFAVEPDVHELEETVIIADVDKESEDYSRDRERQADNVINVVSAKAMEVSPDVTVANVIQRVSGISIERNSNGDGQYAILRGMDKRYNYTLVNGVKIPSPDDKYRYVPLDIFPAEMLERLEVTKSLLPSMEGDAVGGVVNLVMKTAPARRYASANLATGYSELFFDRAYQAYNFKTIDYKSPYEHNGSSYNAKPGDFSNDRITYTLGNPNPNLFAGVALGNRFFREKFGVMVAGSYQNTYRGSNSLFFNSDIASEDKYMYLTSMDQRRYSEQQQRYGLHAMLDYRLNPRTKFKWYNSFVNLGNIQTRDIVSTDLTNGFDPENGNAKMNWSTRSRLTRQRIYNSTLQGEHRLTDKLKINWSAVYSLATGEQPDNTTITSKGNSSNDTITKETVWSMNRRWQHNSDKDLAGYLNFIYDTHIASMPLELSVGGLYRDKERANFYNTYDFRSVDNYRYTDNQIDYSLVQWVIASPRGNYTDQQNYHASEKITAGYGQFKLEVKRLQVVAGARIESTSQGYSVDYPSFVIDASRDQKYVDVLPSANFKYALTRIHHLRASYFRSLNRPGFYEIVPYKVVNENYVERGNPDLKRAIIDNIDIRYEFLPRPQEQIMIGAFYKYLKDPIEFTRQPDEVRIQDLYYMPGNFGNATNMGIEIDAIKYFRYFGVKANYTYTYSTITTPKLLKDRDADGNQRTQSVNQTRPLYGQSPHIANLSLLYNNTRIKFNSQVSVSYTGERINTVSAFYNNDMWQAGFVQMDASVEKTFKRLTVFIKANNLLNTPMTVYIKGTNPKDGNVPYQTMDGKTLIQKDYYQRSYMLGVRFKI